LVRNWCERIRNGFFTLLIKAEPVSAMPRSSQSSPFLQRTLTLCVPLVALIIVGRQVYLSNCYGLSTWKGGGMGMFAAADERSNRYAKVFLVGPGGDRNPLVQLRSDDTNLLDRALEYPIRRNFLRAAKQIAQENWIPAYQRRPVLTVDLNGEPVGAGGKSFRVMVPSELQSDREERGSSMEIQFWKLSYDPITRRAHTTLAETFVFTSQELFEPTVEQRKS
jgi:hypothetical protein